jgi:hypothetical protein
MLGAMNRLRAFALAGVVSGAALAAPAAAIDRSYSVSDFDRVSVEGPYIVHLVTGRPSAARASGSTAALDRVQIDVSGETLRIRRNRDYWGGNDGAQEGVLTIELATRNLRSAWLIGPGSLDVDRAQGLRIDLTLQGSGRLRVGNLAADALSIGLRGSGKFELAGTAGTLTADLQGTGDVDGAHLRAQDATVTTTTTGTVALGAVRSATVNALGIGAVSIFGHPACTVRGPASDQVRCGVPEPRPEPRPARRSDQGQHR